MNLNTISIAECKITQSFKGPLKEWIKEHDGQLPSLESTNMKEKELAQAYIVIKNLKIRKMMGLNYEE